MRRQCRGRGKIRSTQASLGLSAASCVSFHKGKSDPSMSSPRHHKHFAGSTRRKETPEEPQPRLQKVSQGREEFDIPRRRNRLLLEEELRANDKAGNFCLLSWGYF